MLNTNETVSALLPQVTRVVAKYLGKRFSDDVEEHTQEIARALMDRILPSFDPAKQAGPRGLEKYVLMSVRNHCLNVLRHDKVDRRVEPLTDSEGNVRSPLANLADPETPLVTVERKMVKRRLDVAMQSLTERQQALYAAYCEFGEWGLAADSIGVSRPTASREKRAIIEQLRALMVDDDE